MPEETQPRLSIIPLTLAEANALVARWHRHHIPAVGHRFSIGVIDADGIVRGACIVSRPVARLTDDRRVAEVTRLVTDGTPNACSALYAAAARACKAMGFLKIQTFILKEEPGTSLKACGWINDGDSDACNWRRGSRAQSNQFPTGPKQRWVLDLNTDQPNPIFPQEEDDQLQLTLEETNDRMG